jgi:hypothetical protein
MDLKLIDTVETGDLERYCLLKQTVQCLRTAFHKDFVGVLQADRERHEAALTAADTAAEFLAQQLALSVCINSNKNLLAAFKHLPVGPEKTKLAVWALLSRLCRCWGIERAAWDGDHRITCSSLNEGESIQFALRDDQTVHTVRWTIEKGTWGSITREILGFQSAVLMSDSGAIRITKGEGYPLSFLAEFAEPYRYGGHIGTPCGICGYTAAEKEGFSRAAERYSADALFAGWAAGIMEARDIVSQGDSALGRTVVTEKGGAITNDSDG